MALELLFGIQTNGIRHTEADGMPDIDTRFRMVKEAGVYDYVDKTPEPNEIDEFKAASEKYDLPIRAGGWYYTIGRDELLFEKNIKTARLLGSFFHNTQILTYHDDGHPITDNEVVATYMNFSEIGDKYGVIPCFEVHVNMWSEDFRRVATVGRAIEARGAKFNMTLDHSHIIFKIDNPEEQEISNIRDDVKMGKLILDPYVEGNVVQQWIDSGWIRHCHARSTVPNNPKNFDTLSEDGKPGRGIQYPFKKPAPGEYHSEWEEKALEPWKETIRSLMRFHSVDQKNTLGQISTEFIPGTDYGGGCKYSLFEQSIASVQWMRQTWTDIIKAS